MVVDWFTVGAQALNFVVLVWLLKRFLYQPILHAIDAREERIAEGLADAEARKAEAQRERDEFRDKNRDFDEQRARLVRLAAEEAQVERQRLIEEARQAAAALRADLQGALSREQVRLGEEVARRTGEEVFAVARKALTDLASTSLEERLAEVFIRRLREMDDQGKEEFAEAFATAPDPALVRSAFELSASQRGAIEAALHETFVVDVPVAFETAPELISGIEFTANGRRVAWNLASYLTALEEHVGELLKAMPERAAHPDAAGDHR